MVKISIYIYFWYICISEHAKACIQDKSLKSAKGCKQRITKYKGNMQNKFIALNL